MSAASKYCAPIVLYSTPPTWRLSSSRNDFHDMSYFAAPAWLGGFSRTLNWIVRLSHWRGQETLVGHGGGLLDWICTDGCSILAGACCFFANPFCGGLVGVKGGPPSPAPVDFAEARPRPLW